MGRWSKWSQVQRGVWEGKRCQVKHLEMVLLWLRQMQWWLLNYFQLCDNLADDTRIQELHRTIIWSFEHLSILKIRFEAGAVSVILMVRWINLVVIPATACMNFENLGAEQIEVLWGRADGEFMVKCILRQMTKTKLTRMLLRVWDGDPMIYHRNTTNETYNRQWFKMVQCFTSVASKMC